SGRLRGERGFGLIELLMAMTMLNIGLLAVVAAFTSGIWGVARGGAIATASALGDAQMELYRGLPWACIYMPSPPSSGTYSTDSASSTQYQVLSGTPLANTDPAAKTCTGYGVSTANGLPAKATTPSQTVTGPDHHKYEIDTYINYRCSTSPNLTNPTGANPPCPVATPTVTVVTVVVRDGRATTKVLGRQTTLFAWSTD
ncbi:MAG: prepilin-type N-terminal cleavage/methylation domain-containing protein, partial [Acidimicrobiales bacterium]